ncbi:unnamed protein product, partial [Amoebophrya sp. A120]|eukprot:GSA120T00023827001.1
MDLNAEAVRWLAATTSGSDGGTRNSNYGAPTTAANKRASAEMNSTRRDSTTTLLNNNPLPAFQLLHRALKQGIVEKDLFLLAETWANLGLAYRKLQQHEMLQNVSEFGTSSPVHDQQQLQDLAIYNLQLSASLLRRVLDHDNDIEIQNALNALEGASNYTYPTGSSSTTTGSTSLSLDATLQNHSKLASLYLNLSVLHHEKARAAVNKISTSTTCGTTSSQPSNQKNQTRSCFEDDYTAFHLLVPTADPEIEHETALQYGIQCVDMCVSALLRLEQNPNFAVPNLFYAQDQHLLPGSSAQERLSSAATMMYNKNSGTTNSSSSTSSSQQKLYSILALGYNQLGIAYEKVREFRKAYIPCKSIVLVLIAFMHYKYFSSGKSALQIEFVMLSHLFV